MASRLTSSSGSARGVQFAGAAGRKARPPPKSATAMRMMIDERRTGGEFDSGQSEFADPLPPTGLSVRRRQIYREADPALEPERHSGQRALELQRLLPNVHGRMFLALDGAIGRDVKVTLELCGAGVAEQFQQFVVEIRPPLRDHVDHHQADALREQCRALRSECPALLRPVLVSRTNQLDRPNKKQSPLLAIDEHLYGIGCNRQFQRLRR